MSGLKFGRRAALSGQGRSLVVFLHGYGADGADLLGLADPLAAHLQDTVFMAPDAPDACPGTVFGRQWFPIPWIDGSSEQAAAAGLAAATQALNGFLDARMSDEKIGPEAVALVGFSQGAMMAMHVAPRRAEAVAAVVAISGRLLQPEALVQDARVKPPVLLIHGDADPVVPFGDMAKAGQALTAAGFTTFGHVMRGTGHGIAPDGLSAALAFLQKNLPS
jgi:phospholipase/carboxylesterase